MSMKRKIMRHMLVNAGTGPSWRKAKVLHIIWCNGVPENHKILELYKNGNNLEATHSDGSKVSFCLGKIYKYWVSYK